jgi:hypothetical protein
VFVVVKQDVQDGRCGVIMVRNISGTPQILPHRAIIAKAIPVYSWLAKVPESDEEFAKRKTMAALQRSQAMEEGLRLQPPKGMLPEFQEKLWPLMHPEQRVRMFKMMEQYSLEGRLAECQFELWDNCNINPNTSVVANPWWEDDSETALTPEGPGQVLDRGEGKDADGIRQEEIEAG